MTRKHNQFGKLGIMLSAVTTLMLAGGAALAAGVIPGADGIIHGCYDNRTGGLRAIDPATVQCKNNETAISWNQTGPQGLQGERGLQGEEGPQGSSAASLLAARITDLPNMSGMPTSQFGAISGISTQSANADSVAMTSAPVPMIARDLSVRFTVAPMGGNRVVTLLVNGAPSELSCMAYAPHATCTNTNSEVSIPSSASLALRVHTQALVPFTVPATDAQVTWRVTTP